MANESERRAHLRSRTALAGTIWLEGSAHPCLVSNLTRAGALLEGIPRTAIDSDVELRFSLAEPTHREIHCVARVRWSDATGTGVTLGSLRAVDVWALNMTLDSKLPAPLDSPLARP